MWLFSYCRTAYIILRRHILLDPCQRINIICLLCTDRNKLLILTVPWNILGNNELTAKSWSRLCPLNRMCLSFKINLVKSGRTLFRKLIFRPYKTFAHLGRAPRAPSLGDSRKHRHNINIEYVQYIKKLGAPFRCTYYFCPLYGRNLWYLKM